MVWLYQSIKKLTTFREIKSEVMEGSEMYIPWPKQSVGGCANSEVRGGQKSEERCWPSLKGDIE